jgi:succinyl-CoA synthetase beta subunit
MDRKTQGPVIIASSQGGMDIETVAHDTPDEIVTLPIDINVGLDKKAAIEVAQKIGFVGDGVEKVLHVGCHFGGMKFLYNEMT